jgi:hypothetical protein
MQQKGGSQFQKTVKLKGVPYIFDWETTSLTPSTGTANPMPAENPDSEMMTVLSPIRRPAESIRGLYELPELMATSASRGFFHQALFRTIRLTRRFFGL